MLSTTCRCYFNISEVGGWVGYAIYTSVYLTCVEIGVRESMIDAWTLLLLFVYTSATSFYVASALARVSQNVTTFLCSSSGDGVSPRSTKRRNPHHFHGIAAAADVVSPVLCPTSHMDASKIPQFNAVDCACIRDLTPALHCSRIVATFPRHESFVQIYWMHRTLHTNKFLYKYIHALHHKYNSAETLSPWASIAFNPFDGVLQVTVPPTAAFIAGISIFSSCSVLFRVRCG